MFCQLVPPGGDPGIIEASLLVGAAQDPGFLSGAIGRDQSRISDIVRVEEDDGLPRLYLSDAGVAGE